MIISDRLIIIMLLSLVLEPVTWTRRRRLIYENGI